MKKFLIAAGILAMGIFANADVVAEQQLYAAMNTVKSFAFDNKLEYEKIKRVKAIAILTDVSRSSAGVSMQKGDGVFSMKNEYGEWSNPIMIKFSSFGLGPQVGLSSSDVLVLFYTSESFRKIFNGQDYLELNGGGSVGVGREGRIATSLPEIAAYAKASGKLTGVYVGASLDRARITIDDKLTNDLYERIYSYEDILNGSPRDTKYLRAFKSTLAKFLGDSQFYQDSPKNPKEYEVKASDNKARK